MSDFTNVAANFMNNMANPARSASAGYARGQAQREANERTNIARMGVEQENQQMEADREQEVAKKYAGMAMMANTPELWGALQKNGVMQDIPFEGRMEVIAAGLDPSGINSYMNPPITEIADPNSPTGSTMVPRSQAIGKPGMPPSSTEMETITKPDGSTTTRFSMGRGGSKKGGGSLTAPKGAKTALFKDIVASQNSLDSINQISTMYEQDFLTYPGKAKGSWATFMNKLDPNERSEFQQRRAAFLSAANRDFLSFRKWATGVAGGEKEMAEIKRATFSEDDSPQDFEAKLAHAQSLHRRLNARRTAALISGVNNTAAFKEYLEVNPLESFPTLQERGEQLERSGYSEEQTTQMLINEGYINQ